MSIILRAVQTFRPAASRAYVTGSVKWFNSSKGFGFLQTDEPQPREVFVHQSSIQMDGYRYLNEGEKVQFEIDRDDRGLKAVKVRDLKGNPLVREGRAPAPRQQGQQGQRRNNGQQQQAE